MTERVLLLVLALEGVAVATCLLGLVGYVTLRDLRARRREPTLSHARGVLRGVVLAQVPAADGIDALRRLSEGGDLMVLHELARSLEGESLVRLRGVAAGAGIICRAEGWARSRRWWRRLRGLRVLAELRLSSGSVEVTLHDPHPAVRAAAAAAAAYGLTPAVTTATLAMLDDPDPLCRFSAKSALMRAGSAAATAIREHLAADHVAGAVAALEVAIGVADPSFVPAALRLSEVRNNQVRRAATALLGRTAGQAATGRLLGLLEDNDDLVRAVAARSLGELGHWPAAPALYRALRDPVWDVRNSAAVSLRRIGAPGRLYLREAVRSLEAPSGELARQVLALPDGAMSTVNA